MTFFPRFADHHLLFFASGTIPRADDKIVASSFCITEARELRIFEGHIVLVASRFLWMCSGCRVEVGMRNKLVENMFVSDC